MTQPTLINLHHNEYIQRLRYYPFAVNLNRCNALSDPSNSVCVPNKTKGLDLSVFNMVTGVNESKTSTKHISCECKCKFNVDNVTRIKRGITINVGVSKKI